MSKQKVFIADDKFADVHRVLLARGWKENHSHASPYFALKWRNLRTISFAAIDNDQIVNHLQGAAHLCSKALITLHLEGHRNHHAEHSFYPLTFLPFKPKHMSQLFNHALLGRAIYRLSAFIEQGKTLLLVI